MILQPAHDGLSNRDWNMLNRSAAIAMNSTERHKHGAILYKGGRVLAVAVNSVRNRHQSMEIDFADYTRHAEIAVMRAVGWWSVAYEGATLYVVRINRHGEMMLSKPCAPCEQALKVNSIKRVVYSV